MSDTRRTAADIGMPCYINTAAGLRSWADPASRDARRVWIAGTDALALRDKLTAAEAEVERLRTWIDEHGRRTDTCTRSILGVVCADCRCGAKAGARTDGN